MCSEKKCPCCGAAIHAEASFCPYCAKPVNSRKQLMPARRMSRRMLYSILMIFAALIGLTSWWLYTRPRVYDNGTAEARYTMGGQTYQLCIAWDNSSFTPANRRFSRGETDFPYRYPSMLYINHVESDTHAQETFLRQVEHIEAAFVRADEALDISCTPPEPDASYLPNAAVITFVDYEVSQPGTWMAELAFTVYMKNGDIIRVHQEQVFETTPTCRYTSEDAPMNTIEELQALIDEVADTVDPLAEVYITLPPVVYDGKLSMERRGVNLTGSEDGQGNRTTFTGTIQLETEHNNVSYFDGIDFIGSGDGVGISASSRLHMTDCRVAGWRTGALCYGTAWVNANECVFEDNGTGLHFNNTIGNNVSDSQYDSNIFRNNGTAVLLENTGTDISLSFNDSLFSGNGTDIDNRCGQELDLSGALFE